MDLKRRKSLWRRWMGIEPTKRALTRLTGFEDQEGHQASFTSAGWAMYQMFALFIDEHAFVVAAFGEAGRVEAFEQGDEVLA